SYWLRPARACLCVLLLLQTFRMLARAKRSVACEPGARVRRRRRLVRSPSVLRARRARAKRKAAPTRPPLRIANDRTRRKPRRLRATRGKLPGTFVARRRKTPERGLLPEPARPTTAATRIGIRPPRFSLP